MKKIPARDLRIYIMLAALAVACLLAILHWFPGIDLFSALVWSACCAVVIIIVLSWSVIQVFALRTKSRLIRLLSQDAVYTPTTVQQVDYADTECLTRYADALQALGFSLQREVLVTLPSVKGSMFMRYYTHTESSSIAIIIQEAPLPRNTVAPYCYFIQKFTGEWQVLSSSHALSTVTVACRKPKSLWLLRQAMAPEKLYQCHVTFCTALSQEMRITPRAISVDELIQETQQRRREQAEQIRAQSAARFFQKLQNLREDPPVDWYGDYRPSANAFNVRSAV